MSRIVLTESLLMRKAKQRKKIKNGIVTNIFEALTRDSMMQGAYPVY